MTTAAAEPKKIRVRKTSTEPVNGEAVQRLSKETLSTASKMNRLEALAVVQMYEKIQKVRVGANNREKAHERNSDMLSDPAVVRDLKEQLFVLEKQAKRAMLEYASAQPVGRWLLSNDGVGETTAAAFLAYFDITRCCCEPYRHLRGRERDAIPKHDCPGLVTAGHAWSFAGLDPKVQWKKGEIRPYNQRLKTVCYLAASNFKRNSFRDGCFYGKLYLQRKAQEERKNEAGELRDAAFDRLAKVKANRWRIDPKVHTLLESGKLPPGGLDLRAMRWVEKIFVSHWHYVAYNLHFGKEPPKPFAIEHLGHAHTIPVPNWPMKS